jgi:hypothetical protein
VTDVLAQETVDDLMIAPEPFGTMHQRLTPWKETPVSIALHYCLPENRGVRPLGELAWRTARCAERLLLDDIYRPEWITSDITFAYDPTPFHDWYTGHEWTWYADVSGRYLNAWASLAASRGGLPGKALQVLETVLATQAADGHFGPPIPARTCDRSQASGTAWMMLALPRLYALTGDGRVLRAAQRLAEWYLHVLPDWVRPEEIARQTSLGSYALIFSNFTHCLDGLAALQAVAPDPRLVEGALAIAAAVKGFDSEIHSHHFLSTVRGLLDWYELTGETWLLEKAKCESDRIFRDGMLDTWGVPESFASPHTDEGCSEVDWVLVNLRLYQASGERRWLDTAERAIYGHLYMNQTANGGFGAWHGFLTQVGARKAGSVGRYIEAFWCCSMHGAFGLSEIARHVFGRSDDGVRVNLIVGAEAEFLSPGGVIRLRQTAERYPFPGETQVEMSLPDATAHMLRVALPGHSPLQTAELDGLAVPTPATGSELSVRVQGRGEHRLVLRFAVTLRAEPARRQDLFIGKHSLWYGPMPLGTNALLERVAYELTPATLSAATVRPAPGTDRQGSELEVVLAARDAADWPHTRARDELVLYPLAGRTFRGVTHLTYLF